MVSDLTLGNDFRQMVIFAGFAVIASGWNSDGQGEMGGIEMVDLKTGASRRYSTADIPLPNGAVFTIAVQHPASGSYRLWMGTYNGLAVCDISLDELDTAVLPPAPSKPSLELAADSLAVSWSLVQGAASYEVWYGKSEDSSVALRLNADVVKRVATISGLESGLKYFVWVKAKNAAGVGPFNLMASAILAPAPPAAPVLTPGFPASQVQSCSLST